MNIPPLELNNLSSSTPPVSPEEEHKKRKHIENEPHFGKKKSKLDLHSLNTYLSSGKPVNVKDGRYGLNLLCWACQCRSLEAVKCIVQQGSIDINQRHGPHQITALHIAAVVNFTAGIDYLTQHPNLDINQKDLFGLTAAHYAARSDHIEATRILIEAGARLDMYDKKGKLPLHYAIQNASVDLIRLLLVKRERNNPTMINLVWSAATLHDHNVIQETIVVTGNSLILKALLDAGAFIPFEVGGWWESHYAIKQHQILELCVQWNRLECLIYLTQHEALTNVPSKLYRHLLYLAVQQRKLALVKYLVGQVKVNPSYANGHNPSFLYAANHGFMEMIPFLLSPCTSLDCIQQAFVFSSRIGKASSLANLIKAYWKQDFLKKPDIHTALEAFDSILYQ
ncbi:ankyrin repeat-containing domain protein [Gilbertella persicaria]|uniref:ankyrin repeat-containing domain protein n=1 Tax=Gilbertella persicaria TaxID=101096 RepID=UPI0022209843|nr:ankyrin repeat-containing domain protein [Gilbertella persicaria]KAI8050144.1 ankyrin repeat-containing domain protein [Gilbertella persicaria]